MKFKGFTLDPFQEEAAKYIDKGHSVMVSAATGTGKTLIADYIIDKYIHKNKRIIYTAPIKALSGQKYRDFKKEYGEENIGIMTGDVVINPDAPVLIMTTEIYRNMLMAEDDIVNFVSYVIFDEIHFINDIERGTVWEESIIFSPEHIRFLMLSATVPNAKEFAQWIESIKKHTVDVVKYDKRAVPLEHKVYDIHLGITDIDKLMEDDSYPDYYKNMRRRKKKNKKSPMPSHIDLIKQIQDKLPAIVFNFSRRDCENKAIELGRKKNFLNNKERAYVMQKANELISSDYRSLESIQRLKQSLSKGIGFHHAGILPKAKELVELLFTEGLVKVLYATETFAVGINMPAKTVVFAGLEKYDGFSFRYLNAKEYFQMAGRAGRRGIDTRGYVISMIQRGYTDLKKVKKISTVDDIPIQSRFQLSINTVLNLINNHTKEEREKILRMNFDYFLKKKRSDKQVRIMSTFNNKVKKLKKLDYIFGDALTDKGKFATRIYSDEILITETFCSDLHEQLTETEVNILIAAIIYESRKRDYFTLKRSKRMYDKINSVISQNKYVEKKVNKLHLKRMIRTIGDFSEGADFKELLELSNLDEGDLIRLIRRVIDMIRQIRHASDDYDLRDKLHRCQDRLYRDVVRFEF